MNVLKGIMLWMISPIYFTFRFMRYFLWDMKESLKDNFNEEYYDSYIELYKKTRQVRNGEVDWMGNRLKEREDFKDVYKE